MKTRLRLLTESEKLNLGDVDYISFLLDLYPTGIVSIVSDSFDYWNTVTNTARILKDKIMARDGKVVFRPDTGDPIKIVVGEIFEDFTGKCKNLDDVKVWAKESLVDKAAEETPHGECGPYEVEGIFKFNNDYYKVKVDIEWNRYDKQYYYIDGSRLLSFETTELTPEQKGSIEVLWEIFGGTITDKGYKQLDSHVGLIYGDSITLERAKAICEGLKSKGFASTNLVYGIGSYTYQYVTRDTDGYAVKATYAEVNIVGALGSAVEAREIYKNPKTDDGTKKSAKGLTAVFKDEKGEFYLKDQATWDELLNCELIPVFKDGVLLKDWTLAEVRANLASNL